MTSGLTAKPKNDDFDPQAPLIGSDGLEYEDLAARIEGRAIQCWRNDHIRDSRARGVRESDIRTWIKAYDEGGEPGDRAEHRAKRVIRANFAIDRFGRSLLDHGRAAEPVQWHPSPTDRTGQYF